jgi:hypothetical protein
MDPKGGKVSTLTKSMLAGGAAAMLVSALAFASSIGVASRNKEGLAYWTHVQKKPAHAFRAEQTSPATDVLGFGGLALGIAGLSLGLARTRRERRSPFYRIGTAPDVELATDAVAAPSFPLVAPRGDDFVFNFTAGIDGEMTVDGATTPLASLGRPSPTIAGALEVAIPPKARIRARAGQTTFLVSAVARPKEQPVPFLALESRTAMFFAASLAAHVGLWGIAQLSSEAASGTTLDIATTEGTEISAHSVEKETAPDKPEHDDGNNQESGSKDGGQTAMAEGTMGTTQSTNAQGHLRIEDRSPTKALSRAEAEDYARRAGIMGSEVLRDSIGRLSGEDGAITSGMDAQTVWGGLYGPEGQSFGTGTGRMGWNLGGGCTVDCGGVGIGRNYHTIGQDRGAGDGYHPGGFGHGDGPGRHSAVPPVTISHPYSTGDGLDREIIRRYVNRQRARIQYCYEKELLAKSTLEGDVTVQFLIMPDGTVSTSAGAGMDNNVASCVADTIHDIAFPKPTDGGSVQVKYPFHFRHPQ